MSALPRFVNRDFMHGSDPREPVSQKDVARIDHISADRGFDQASPIENSEKSTETDAIAYSNHESYAPIPLIHALAIIAQNWFGRAPQTMNSKTQEDPIPPETLIALGADMGLDVVMLESSLDHIETADCPCLVVDRKGYAHILIQRLNSDLFLCHSREGTIELRTVEILNDYSGVLFRISPLSIFGSEETQNDNSPVESVLRLIAAIMFKRQRAALFHLTVATAISNILLLAVPMFSMAVYDRVLPHMAYETLWALTIGIMIALGADLGLRQVKLRIIDSIAADVSHVIQVRLFKRLLHGKMNNLPRTGGVMAQNVRDLESYCQTVPMTFLSASVDLPFVAITTIILIGVAGTVALVPLLGGLMIAVVYYGAHLIGHAKLAPYLAMMRTQSNTMIETIEGIEAVKTAGAEAKLLNRWERLTDAAALGSHESRLSYGVAAQVAMTLSQVMTVAALVLGVYEISINAMTVGALSAATMLIGRLVSPITQLVAQAQRLTQAGKTLEPIRQVLNADIERAGDLSAEAHRPFLGQMEFINVSFSYPDTQTPSLDEISVTFRPGERIGIIGRVGSGKSTLLRLLARLQDPTSGVIRLDGSDIRQVSPRVLRNSITYMKQDTGLFDDTLRANIVLGVDRPDPELVEQAVAISGVSILASRSPEGYGMRVGPRGDRLSGGEKQAVGLARAVLKNPRMLLLDEPTASMDNTIERHIINGLKQWIGDRTLIIATHRAAMLDLVDRVILLHDGKILADGPKSDVLRKLNGQN